MDWKKDLAELWIDLLAMIAIGGNIMYFIISVVGYDMKRILVSGISLIAITVFFSWRKRVRVRENRALRVCKRKFNEYNRNKIYRIKRVVDQYDLPDIVAQYDFCLFQDRSILNGEFEMLVYVRDIEDFSVLAERLKWKIDDPLKLIFRVSSLSYKEVSETITDVLGTTLVS